MYHSNLALLINELGRLEEAETHYYEVLENCRRAFGDDHATTLSTMSNIGSLLHEQGRLEESEKYFREVLDRRRRLLNEDDPELLTSVNNMGVVLGQQGRREEARPYYREALERCRRLLGDDHPDTLVSIANKSALLSTAPSTTSSTCIVGGTTLNRGMATMTRWPHGRPRWMTILREPRAISTHNRRCRIAKPVRAQSN